MLPEDNIEYTTYKLRSKEQFSHPLVCAIRSLAGAVVSACMYIMAHVPRTPYPRDNFTSRLYDETEKGIARGTAPFSSY